MTSFSNSKASKASLVGGIVGTSTSVWSMVGLAASLGGFAKGGLLQLLLALIEFIDNIDEKKK